MENIFKTKLRKELKLLFPGCTVINNDPIDNSGISDILILYKETWAMLEAKRSSTASLRPNQEYYIQLFNDLSYGAIIHPENKNYILKELENWFRFVETFELKRNFTVGGF